MKKHYGKILPMFALLPVVGLIGCGGSGSDGGTTGGRTVGAITAVGATSVTVSGSTFETGSSTVSGDEVSSTDQLKPGMVVKVDGTMDSSNHGTAHDIDYDAEVEGRVDVNDLAGGGDFIVMGQIIDMSKNPYFDNDDMPMYATIADIPVGAMVEVSGYSDGMGKIVATYIELEDDSTDSSDDMELEGTVTAHDPANGTFKIGDQTIHYDPNTINMMIKDGMNVEVDMHMDDMGNMHAYEIEEEDDYSDDYSSDGEVEIEGMVTSDGVTEDGTFEISAEKTVTVKLGDNVKFEDGLTEADIVNGAFIEVEGYLDENGVLIAHEVSREGDDDSEDDSSDDSSDDSTDDSTDSSTDTSPDSSADDQTTI
ncbi:DUF5666 domain-containing protein [Kaarinaea lacus]